MIAQELLSAATAALSRAHVGRVALARNRQNYSLGGSHKATFAYAASAGFSHVVVLHGVMGGELTTYDHEGDDDLVWVNLVRLALGRLARLKLKEDGASSADPDYDARATGILKRYYGETLLSLAQRWNVRPG